MKINKTLTLLSMVTLLVATTMISSCKYEEGPAISLRSKKARVAGEWSIEKITANGEDVTAFLLLFGAPTYTFDKDGSFSITMGTETMKGKWEFDSSKEAIILTYDGDPDKETWTILKLKNKEFWATYVDVDPDTDETTNYEVHLAAK